MKRTILRMPAVKIESGLSRSTIYLRVSQGLWTRPVSLGYRAVGWPSDEVEALNAARIAGKTDDEIRDLVATAGSGAQGCDGMRAMMDAALTVFQSDPAGTEKTGETEFTGNQEFLRRSFSESWAGHGRWWSASRETPGPFPRSSGTAGRGGATVIGPAIPQPMPIITSASRFSCRMKVANFGGRRRASMPYMR